jgi:hypothetical protein
VAVTSRIRDDLKCETVVDLEWCNRATLYIYAKTAQRQVIAFFQQQLNFIHPYRRIRDFCKHDELDRE